MKRVVKQQCSLLCVAAAEKPCSRHANLQVQSRGTIKSLLLAILTDIHFSQDLPFGQGFSMYSLHSHCSPKEAGINLSNESQPYEILAWPHTLGKAHSGTLVCATLHGYTECQRMCHQQQQQRNSVNLSSSPENCMAFCNSLCSHCSLFHHQCVRIIPQVIWPWHPRGFSCMFILQLDHSGWGCVW